MWFKNRRAKCRQQLQHQTSSSVNSSKTTTGNNSSSASRNSSNNNNSSSTNASSKNSSATSGNNSSNKTSNNNNNSSSNPLKSSSHHHSGTNSSNNNNSSATNNNTNSTNNNTGTPNGLGIGQHNPSPILPMTPSTSVSPPINVICKKEISSFHHHNTSNGSVGGANNDSSLKSSAYDSLKSDPDLSGLSHHPSAYANINSRLGGQTTGTGNLTPLGSNSSIMTTPSPPITPQNHNHLSYVPNHEHNFWYNPQYNQYPSNYNASYYTQMDYFQNQSQSNYNMGHSGYSTSNFGLNSGTSLGGAMSAQAFSPNLDYMPQDKYVNMV